MKTFALHALVLTLGLVAFASPAHAANQTWNPGGVGGGAGIWSGSNWGSEAAWVAGNTAVFDGTAGAVTVGMQTAGGLTFNTSGYKLAAPGTLTLAGAPVVLKLGQGVTATFDVGLLPAGAGGLRLCLMGGGTLSLTTDARRTLGTAANPAIWTVTGSTLAFTSGDNLGAAPSAPTTSLILDNATVRNTAAKAPSFFHNRLIQINAAGGAWEDTAGGNRCGRADRG